VLVRNAEVAPVRRAFATLLLSLQNHEEEEVAILVELERLVNATSAPAAASSLPPAQEHRPNAAAREQAPLRHGAIGGPRRSP